MRGRARERRGWSLALKRYVCILFMGFVGASLRYVLEFLCQNSSFPLGTLIINVFGCVFIELLYGYFGRRSLLPDVIISGMGVGLIGAFTAMAVFCGESIDLMVAGHYGVALLYSLATISCCMLGIMLGDLINGYLSRRRLAKLRAMRRERRRVRQSGVGDGR